MKKYRIFSNPMQRYTFFCVRTQLFHKTFKKIYYNRHKSSTKKRKRALTYSICPSFKEKGCPSDFPIVGEALKRAL